jgi:hypothetical protein
MEWFVFGIKIWLLARQVEQYHQWIDHELRDRFDELPCRDCNVPEGMWW